MPANNIVYIFDSLFDTQVFCIQAHSRTGTLVVGWPRLLKLLFHSFVPIKIVALFKCVQAGNFQRVGLCCQMQLWTCKFIKIGNYTCTVQSWPWIGSGMSKHMHRPNQVSSCRHAILKWDIPNAANFPTENLKKHVTNVCGGCIYESISSIAAAVCCCVKVTCLGGDSCTAQPVLGAIDFELNGIFGRCSTQLMSCIHFFSSQTGSRERTQHSWNERSLDMTPSWGPEWSSWQAL